MTFRVCIAVLAACLMSFIDCADPVNKTKLIIVGAGASGIAAATKLVSHGIQDFVILEAEDRIGGRVNTVPYEGNTSIDMGAQWIHGHSNSVYKMAKEHNLVDSGCDIHNGLFKFYNSSGKLIDNEDFETILILMDEILDDRTDLATQHNVSVGDYARDRLIQELKKNSSLSHLLSAPFFDEMLNYFGKYQNSWDGSDSWFETSVQANADYESYEECDATPWKKGGYGNVLKLLLKQFPGETPIDLSKQLRLNQEVQKVDWSDPDRVVVTCTDGSEYVAEQVLTTVSVGVLKSSPGLFVPPLPEWKTKAIEGWSFGTVNKIFLRFPHKWWTEGLIGINLVWTAQDEKTLFKDVGGVDGKPWVVDIIGFFQTSEDPLTLIGWICGPSSRYMETLTDDQVGNDTIKLLHRFLDSNFTIPDPVRVVKSSWFSNKHFKGSYGCPSLTSEKFNASSKELGNPVLNGEGKPVLLFAGEATNPTSYGTVHGAVESGWREAERIERSNEVENKIEGSTKTI